MKFLNYFFLFIIFLFLSELTLQAAPCYGTKLPAKGKFFGGFQTHIIFDRYLEESRGELRSTQNFFQLSWGLLDWLAIDLKGGAGNLKQNPSNRDEIDYSSSFAGGYGFRLRLLNAEKTRLVFGFQHISVHPYSTQLEDTKNKAVLDDWQTSFLVSYDFSKFTPYLGLKLSRVDYIHWVEENRKREMSDLTKTIGLVCGLDIPFSKNTWFNLEGQFLDSEAIAFGINFAF
ncbi:MAG: hypothetical protein KBB01_05730 [Candidatus Omnitrophica bacterium]|jgi:hypothetical protein|nr:hypothetical protein [Candidatus Omnitrophota bacterium]